MKHKSLRDLRAAKGETIRQVAIALGCTEKSYSSWEGRERQPESNYLIALADHFGVDPRVIHAMTLPEPVAKVAR